ncbi:Bud emergence protein 4 [Wickerhamomyces ciferrii]|uniref:Bud emergence protein 4 n=1 Tax=Wickerhamomyces ciferrii (strain ATCC 14091 / BCRC 22168 / CBS 111 / JCM 3599 / NBRC 0793 / NRRL Y-1031 F-60-10) TaxID=1206466 RepID=K0KSP3_WICCF|nr:Bud emergence protein 4 [Wickerhamomyces ciferrii]CCH45067.1 Bud emergence protein 4 [Wickerhamomyces ciferrii]
MDLEHVLFGLSPFVNDCEEKKLNVDNVYRDSYLKLLDQLAVLLRNPETRNHELIHSNLNKFIGAGDYLILNLDNTGYEELLMELIRVLANAIADNVVNRELLASNTQFIKNLADHLEEHPEEESLNERILILLKNLVIDSPDSAKEISFISQQVIDYISITKNDIFAAVDLLTDLVKCMNYKADPQVIESLSIRLYKVLENQSNFDDEDEFSELAVSLSTILEDITVNPKFNFNDEVIEQILQARFADTLRLLAKLEFQNKLMARRRIFASIGNISANLSTSNKSLREVSIQIIKDQNEQNGYIVSAASTILGNSISSAADRNEVLDQEPQLVDFLLLKYNCLIDPIQFQGILHLLKTLMSIDTVGSLFAEKNFKIFVLLIEATVRNSKYYTNFTSLLVAFLKKTFVLMNKSNVTKIIESDIPQNIIAADSNVELNTILLLLLNKVVIYLPNADIKPITTKVLTFKDNIPASYLFEVTKTIGVLLQHKPDFTLENHTSSLLTLLTTVNSIDSKSTDNSAKSVLNNGRYIAGSLLTIHKTKPIDADLFAIADKVLRK